MTQQSVIFHPICVDEGYTAHLGTSSEKSEKSRVEVALYNTL